MNRYIHIALIVGLGMIILSGCQKKPKDEGLFEQARVFQENNEYEKAIESYQEVIRLYPDGERADEAQFMIGFIYANDIADTTKAREAYKLFMDKYSATADTGMILSARWEMEHLGRDISDIEQLKIFTGEEEETKAEDSKETTVKTVEK